MGNSGRNHDPAMTGWNAPIPNLRTLTPKRRGSTQAAVRRACAIRASNPTRQAAVARIMPGSCKARTHARLAQAQHRLFADQVQRVAEPDRRRRLAFAGRGRGDGGHQDQLGVGPGGQRADIVERDLRLVFAEGSTASAGMRSLSPAIAPIGCIAASRAISILDFGFLCCSSRRATAFLHNW